MEVYLDNAATSHPKPDSVLKSVCDALTMYNGNPGRSGHHRALAGARILLSCREALAELIGAENPENIVFCFNCTDALNLAIKGSLHKGDHVIASMLEHNSVLRVLSELQARGQIALTLLTPGADGMVTPEQYTSALRGNTALAVLTHASNVTGAIQPVAAIGAQMQARGIRFLVDGAQAIGHIPVNVRALKCSLYAFPGHKGLLGPQGTGGLYIQPGLQLGTVREGGTGSSSDDMRQPSEMPERYESGTVNLPGIAGLLAGVQHIKRFPIEALVKERRLTEYLFEGLQEQKVPLYTPADVAARVGVVSFNIGDYTSSQAADLLAQNDIAVRGGLHCAPGAHRFLDTLQRGAVRASIGWATTEQDVEALLRSVHELQKQ